MRAPNLGLRARFLAACLLLVSVSTAGYFVAVTQFVGFLEVELHDIALQGALQQFVQDYRLDPRQARGPHAGGMSSHVLPPGADESLLPGRLRRLSPGVHDDIRLAGREVAVAREDVAGARLYVVLDMEPAEQLEARFLAVAWSCALLSWAAAVVLALWLARRVMQPINRLAGRVAELQPGMAQERLTQQFGDDATGVISAAFDRFMERTQAFVSREQAFTEDASHELRTPLSVIDSATQLLADDPQLPVQARERVQRIRRAVLQMQSLIEALLFLSREQGGGAASEELPLDQLVTEIADSHRELAAAKRLELSISTVPTVLRAPRGMAACVIGNLLLNAIHFTERGWIDIRVEPGRFWIQDSGIGIPPQELERIFERHFRGTHSRGVGLGLYLVKRICDRLGWTVQAGSSAGAGTRFEVSFRSG